jgi:hypothetical protein
MKVYDPKKEMIMPLKQHDIDELRDRGFHIDGDFAIVGSGDGQITITATPRHDRDGTAFWLLEIALPNGSQMAAVAYPEPDAMQMVTGNPHILSRPQE